MQLAFTIVLFFVAANSLRTSLPSVKVWAGQALIELRRGRSCNWGRVAYLCVLVLLGAALPAYLAMLLFMRMFPGGTA